MFVIVLDIVRDRELNNLSCNGIEIVGVEYNKLTFKEQQNQESLLETYQFISYEDREKTSLSNALNIICQLILQNLPGPEKKPSICEVKDIENESFLTTEFRKILDEQPFIDAVYVESDLRNIKDKHDVILWRKCDLLQLSGYDVTALLREGGFVVFVGSENDFGKNTLEQIMEFVTDYGPIHLLRQVYDLPSDYSISKISSSNYCWVTELTKMSQQEKCKVIYLLAQNNDMSGIVGLVKCLVSEASNVEFKAISIGNYNGCFTLENKFFRNQLRKNLVLNILKGNKWGTYIHKRLCNVQKSIVKNASVQMSIPREFSTLNWVATPLEFQR